MDEMKKELENEISELVEGRINEIARASADTKENTANDAVEDYFGRVARWLCEVLAYRRFLSEDGLRADEKLLFDWQERLYAPILPVNYETSYANPTYAVSRLGDEVGGLLSMAAAEFLALVPWTAQGRDDLVRIYLELFVQLYGCVGENDGETAASLKDAIYWFYHDYSEVFVADTITDRILPKDSCIDRLIKTAELTDLRYLFSYGYYVTDNEYRLAEYLNQQDESLIQKMADTFVEGLRMGYVAAGKDMSAKKTVSISYPVGMERVVRLAVKGFAKLGLEPTYQPQAVISANGRGVNSRTVFSVPVNPQFLYDHKDDRGYYFDMRYVNRCEEVARHTYTENETMAAAYGGPTYIEMFGEPRFEPKNYPANCRYTDEQNGFSVTLDGKMATLADAYLHSDSYSFTIISWPYPSIGERFEEIFKETVRINTLDYMTYRNIQQKLIDVLDRGDYVRVKGTGDNCTDMRVYLMKLSDPAKETKFENCVADVNIPVGEVFTSPVLKGTTGTLFVSRVCIGEYTFRNLKITFEDGWATDYTCDNFEDEAENKKLIVDVLMHRHEHLPIGEFAIGTNTDAYRMAKDFDIFDRLPILIAEKTGPHFAVGDTCYSHEEEVVMRNPDGKEVIARENEVSKCRSEDPDKAYFNWHRDITIPFEEIGEITAVSETGEEFVLIKNGRFVVEGTQALNEPLEAGR